VILLLNGPNLNLLGEREAGAATLADVERMVEQTCAAHGLPVRSFQSSSEGAILDFVHAHRHEARGVLVNPGALAQGSWALRDCLAALGVPAVEVHLANERAREPARPASVLATAVRGRIEGLGVEGYRLAALWLCRELAAEAAEALEAAPAAPAAPAARRRPPPGPAGGAQPAPGHEGSSGRSWAGRAIEPSDLGAPDEDIPVDLTKRGDYEPL
jgi:3-dehydroquinate dehydratase-2